MTRVVCIAAAALLSAIAVAQDRTASPVGNDPAFVPGFSSRKNVVLAAVVVRDQKGEAVSGLTKEDFLLFDRELPQRISEFSIERVEEPLRAAAVRAAATPAGAAPGRTALPARFIAYVFDDLHAGTADLEAARTAVDRRMAPALRAGGRIAIFNTSGQHQADFTGDPHRLRDSLSRKRARAPAEPKETCAPMSYYVAERIVNHDDRAAINAIAEQQVGCTKAAGKKTRRSGADDDEPARRVRVAAGQALNSGDENAHAALTVLEEAVRKLAGSPGERLLIVISPGFVVPDVMRYQEMEILDHALRNSVTIGTIGAKGLAGAGASDFGSALYARESQAAEEATLAELAAGTGGQFARRAGDPDAALRRASERPENLYVLGFSPPADAGDGKYHELKVSLRSGAVRPGYSVAARSGYFALKRADPMEQLRKDIGFFLFARNEQTDIPITFTQEFSKGQDGKYTLNLDTKIDIRPLLLQKENGIDTDGVVIVAGVFDEDGKLVDSMQKGFSLRLTDQTPANLDSSPAAQAVDVKGSFELKRGRYLVRLLVREIEGHKTTLRNVPVELR